MLSEHGQYCPVALGGEVLADRWILLILRELVIGSTRFNDIERGLPGISRTLLAQRLRRLERDGVVRRIPARAGQGSEYELTDAGRDLEQVLMAIGAWAVRWRFAEPQPPDADPVVLTWWMHRRVDPAAFPNRRVVIQFDYRGERRMSIWLVFDRGEASVCMQHPGFDSDVVVTTTPVALLRVFNGFDSLADATRSGAVRIDGPPSLTGRFGRWFIWSPFADEVRATFGGVERQFS